MNKLLAMLIARMALLRPAAAPALRRAPALGLRVLVLAIAALAVLLFHIHSWRNYEGPKRFVVLFGAAAGLGLYLCSSPRRRGRQPLPIGPPVQLLLFGAALSTLFAANIAEGMEDLGDLAARVGLCYLAARTLFSWHDARRALHLVVLLGLICSGYAVTQFYGFVPAWIGFTRQPVSTPGNINYAAEVYNIVFWCALPLLSLHLGRRNTGGAAFCTAALAFLLWGYYLSDSRAAHAALAASLTVAGSAWGYARGLPRLLHPRAFVFRPAAAVVALTLVYPALSLVWIRAAEVKTDRHGVHRALMLALGAMPQFAAAGVTHVGTTADQLATRMYYEMQQASPWLWLVPVDDMHYRLAAHGLGLAALLTAAWRWLDRRGILNGETAPPWRVLARCGLLAVALAGFAAAPAPTSRFLVVVALSAAVAAGAALLARASAAMPSLAVLRAAAVAATLCAGLIVGGLATAKVCRHPVIIETMNGRLPRQELNINTILFRLEVYKSTLLTCADNPWFGVGAGNFKVIHELYTSQSEREVLGEDVLARKVHNTAIQYAAEYGAAGLLGLLWLAAAFYRFCWRLMRLGASQGALAFSHRRAEAAFVLGLAGLGTMTAVMVNDLFGHTLVLPAQATLFWCVLGVVCGAGQSLLVSSEAAAAPPPRRPGTAYAVAALAVLGVVFVAVMSARQFMGEVFLRHMMFARDVSFYQGEDPTFQPRWGRSALGYAVQRCLPVPMESVYRRFGAFDHGRHAIAVYPWQMEQYYILGRYYIDAVDEIERSLAPAMQFESAADYYNRLLSGLHKAGRLSAAQLAELRQRPTLAVLRDAFWRHGGIQPQRRDEYIEDGLALYNVNLYMNPNYKWGHNNLGVQRDRTGDRAYSRGAYLRALILDPAQVYGHYNLALGYLYERDYGKAAMYLENVLELKPTHWNAYRHAAQCYQALGNPAAALRRYEALLLRCGALRPGYRARPGAPPVDLADAIERASGITNPQPEEPLELGAALYSLAGLYVTLGETQRATRCYGLAHQADPDNELYLRLYANGLVAEERWTEALPVLRRLAELLQQKTAVGPAEAGAVLYELGRCAAHTGDTALAAAALGEAFSLHAPLREQARRDAGLRNLAARHSELARLLAAP